MSRVTVNPAAVSKINWTNGIAFVAGVAAIFGLNLDAHLQAQIVTGISLALPIVNIVLRTFFTAKPT